MGWLFLVLLDCQNIDYLTLGVRVSRSARMVNYSKWIVDFVSVLIPLYYIDEYAGILLLEFFGLADCEWECDVLKIVACFEFLY